MPVVSTELRVATAEINGLIPVVSTELSVATAEINGFTPTAITLERVSAT